jgi:hypothetical protein
LGKPLIDAQCGACCDGLQATGVNRNQGAESTLAYLWTEMHQSEIAHALAGNRTTSVASA